MATIDAAREIVAQEGKQFDPNVVAAFRKVVKDFEQARLKYKDELEGIHDLDFGA